MLKYTICFIKKNGELLLINRRKSPNMGKWNGVGGKIEKDESPYQGVMREVLEETGLELDEVVHAGNVIWKSDMEVSGMYVFLADLLKDVHLPTPLKMDEGILDWKPLEWILHPDNGGVVSNMKMFLPKMLNGEYGLEHIFEYVGEDVVNYTTSPLPIRV
ncbi:NUDIX hydrolase [Neobacillus mesonae]|uniref:8-oxo-dGTP diphosphatase n=1 Tax=Neobacillus mesonae TaxID=1193713 RepID=A0A3Q9QW68_9BACI|nr:8-oxo-dGTP diphosphatase [Neobacillus mesonae]AZU64711.1 8-oxo-dGTP diphosphatase [Neobacillus mesonae]